MSISAPDTGGIPTERHGHTATVMGDYIWIFGGCGNNMTLLNDMVIMRATDPNRLGWEWLRFGPNDDKLTRETDPLATGASTGPDANIPAPRAFHSAIAWKKHYIVVYGGKISMDASS